LNTAQPSGHHTLKTENRNRKGSTQSSQIHRRYRPWAEIAYRAPPHTPSNPTNFCCPLICRFGKKTCSHWIFWDELTFLSPFLHPFDNFAWFSDFFILHCCWGLVAYEQLLEYKIWGLVDSWLYYRSNEYKLLIFYEVQ
jgi:hypothetical protein